MIAPPVTKKKARAPMTKGCQEIALHFLPFVDLRFSPPEAISETLVLETLISLNAELRLGVSRSKVPRHRFTNAEPLNRNSRESRRTRSRLRRATWFAIHYSQASDFARYLSSVMLKMESCCNAMPMRR